MANPQLQINVGANMAAAVAGFNSLGAAGEHAFDEISAGAAAMARIEAAIESAAAAARDAGTALKLIGSSAITTITPLNTLEARLQDIREAISRSATVQGAANLGAQYEVINRNLQQTKNQIDAATRSAIGLGNAFNTAASAGTGLNRLAPAIRPVLTNLTLIPPAANAAAASIDRFKRSSTAATGTLTDFSRIVQDAPFGLIGITNNLTQLPDSLSRLSAAARESGKSIGSLLLSSLRGFGGIGLALSAVTSGILIYQNGIAGFNRKTKEAKENADELTKALEATRTAANVEFSAVGGVQGQIIQIEALTNAVRNDTLSQEQRANALTRLQAINKEYFGDIKLGKTSLDELTKASNEYVESLTRQAIVTELTSEIGKIGAAYVKQRQAVNELRDQIKQFIAEKGLETKFDANGKAILDFTKGSAIAQSQLRAMNRTLKEQEDALLPVSNAYNGLRIALRDSTTGLLDFKVKSSNTEADKKAEDALKRRIDALKTLRDEIGLSNIQQREFVQLEIQLLRRDGIKLGFTPQEIEDRVQELIRSTRFGRALAGIPIEVTLLARPRVEIDVAGVTLPDGIADGAFDGVINAIKKSAEDAKRKIGEISIDMKEFVQSALTNAFTSIGEGIGEALSGGGIRSIVGAFITTIGEAISALGRAAVAAGVAALLIKTTIEKFIIKNPALIIAAGVAAIAIGKALQASFSNTKIPGFADGVTGFSGGLALVGERGPELVRLPAGSDVIPNNRLGDLSRGNSIQLQSVLYGEDIYLSTKNVASRKRRI